MLTPIDRSMPERRLVRVLIVDDTPQVRQDLHLLLQLTGELEVVGEASNGMEAITQAEAVQPDVVVMDIEMPGMDGYEATRQIKARGLAARVVVLSIHVDSDNVQRAREAGADVFVDKAARFEKLLSAIVVTQ